MLFSVPGTMAVPGTNFYEVLISKPLLFSIILLYNTVRTGIGGNNGIKSISWVKIQGRKNCYNK